ncbi:hypothetical protein ACKKBF_B16065 [Auxenochlorella protothecoides x Auxenochlorella symbiontica]|uniref:Uncharacterized protein n=1 Tax=Auxenochlorella protothecoides TaxID=3075 RepID=A0A1D2A8Y4_AUXPR
MARGRGRGRGGRSRQPGREDDQDVFDYQPERGQSSNVGLLPPSDSDDSDSEDEKPKLKQNARVGELPSSSSDEDDSSSSSESEPEVEAPRQPRKRPEDEVDPAQIEADMARLRLIKEKREADRLKRIAEEGFDRYAPPGSDKAKPETVLPKDHPSLRKA